MSTLTLVRGADVERAARQFLGVRWRHQGRTAQGLDCAGLVIRVAHDLGLTAFDTRDYGRIPIDGQMRAVMQEQCIELPPDTEPRAGHVALLRFAREPQHVAIVATHPLGGLSLLHALTFERKVVEHRLDRTWRNRFVALYALPGVTYPEQA